MTNLLADEIQEVGRENLAGLKWNASEHFELGYWSDKSATEAVEWAAEQLFGIGINSTDRGPKLIDCGCRISINGQYFSPYGPHAISSAFRFSKTLKSALQKERGDGHI